MINEKRSYTEYDVQSTTTDFALGFENSGISTTSDFKVTLNGVDVATLGYITRLKNDLTLEIIPAVELGRVRIARVTNVDEPVHKFTAGALFTAQSVDDNFTQIRLSQQEVLDNFVYLATNTDSVLSAVKLTNTEAKELIKSMQYYLAQGNTIESLTVEMLPTDATPVVESGGTPQHRTFHLKIPKGDKGDKGDVDIATFDVDVQTGDLLMYTSVGYDGATFAINDNRLEVTI